MPDLSYQFRLGLRRGLETYTLTYDALAWSSGSLALRDVAAIRVYSIPGSGQATRRCAIRGRDGREILLSDTHFVGLGKFENRARTYLPFLRALVRAVAERAPTARLVSGMPPLMWWFWITLFGAYGALAALCAVAAVGLFVQKGITRDNCAFALTVALLAIAPVSYLRALWRLRTRPLDPSEI
jgi:hypothetical protein